MHLNISPALKHFVTGLAAAATLVLGSALVSLSTSQGVHFDWRAWLTGLGFAEAGAIGSYIVAHVKISVDS